MSDEWNRKKPLREPPGWCNVLHGYRLLGLEIVGGGWTFLPKESLAAVMDRCASDLVEVPPDGPGALDADALAKIYAFPVGIWFAAAVRLGKLHTAYGLRGGGRLCPMDRDQWVTTDPMLRFKTGLFDPEDPFSEAADLPCRIYVSWDSLTRLIDEVAAWRAELPEFGWPHLGHVDQGPLADDGVDCIIQDTALRLRKSGRRGYIMSAPWPSMFREPPILAVLSRAANDTTLDDPPSATGQEGAEGCAGSSRSQFRGRPGPKINMDWRNKVRGYCRLVGRDAVSNPGIGKGEFHRLVKEHYKMGEGDKPRDPRRTNDWRQEWLDEQAGLRPA